MAEETWRELVDLERLEAWMDERGIESGPLEDLTQLTGGTQNILLKFSRGGRPFVLRRPPRHPRMNGNDIMRREARVLGALASTDVPHPRLIAACDTEDILGVAFYLMEPVDGFNATVGLPKLHAGDPAVRRRMGLSMIDASLALGRVDHLAVGLADFGKVEGYLQRQVPRWRALLESYREYEGWPGPGEIPGVDRVADWLEANRPASFTPGVIHGDYHLANVMFRHDSGELAAMVDWELATIGDPLIDLGWLLATWPEDDGSRPGSPVVVHPWEGFPKQTELVAHYAAGTTRDMRAVEWYAVLACYKLGIILEGSHARAFAGKAPRPIGDRLHATTLGLFERALARIGRA
jgi:aminoglycoside phosphotransferase (APT) family kinase protein